MRLLIDDANIEMIKQLYDYLPIDGVTCNPSIIARSGRKPYEVLKEIREFIGSDDELHVQVISNEADEMMREADRIIKELGEKTFIKIPVTREGLKVIKRLHKNGIGATATAIYYQMQGYLAAKAGANYAAPYVNRIDNLEVNGIHVAKDLHDIYLKNNFKTEILAASFKNSLQVLELVKHGIAVTVSPDVLAPFIGSELVDRAVIDFKNDFETYYGKGINMLNI